MLRYGLRSQSHMRGRASRGQPHITAWIHNVPVCIGYSKYPLAETIGEISFERQVLPGKRNTNRASTFKAVNTLKVLGGLAL